MDHTSDNTWKMMAFSKKMGHYKRVTETVRQTYNFLLLFSLFQFGLLESKFNSVSTIS